MGRFASRKEHQAHHHMSLLSRCLIVDGKRTRLWFTLILYERLHRLFHFREEQITAFLMGLVRVEQLLRKRHAISILYHRGMRLHTFLQQQVLWEQFTSIDRI